MQNVEQTNSETGVLTDAELEGIDGGSWFSRAVHFVHDLFAGPGDVRRSIDRPN
jgi:hypothetical protein